MGTPNVSVQGDAALQHEYAMYVESVPALDIRRVADGIKVGGEQMHVPFGRIEEVRRRALQWSRPVCRDGFRAVFLGAVHAIVVSDALEQHPDVVQEERIDCRANAEA